MKVLVLGAGGQVGQALVKSAPRGVTLLAASHHDLDIADESAVQAYVRRSQPNAIVNAAAYTAVDRAETEPGIAQRVNTTGPRHLASIARDCEIRLIHLSTDYVFDGTSSTPYRPEYATRPLNVYGDTKRRGEEAVLEILADRALILRTSWVYAARGRNFLNTMLARMRDKRAVRVVADQIGAPTAADSVAGALWNLIAQPELAGIFHWTDAGVASWYDFAVAIAEEGALRNLVPQDVTVTPIPSSGYPTHAVRPRFSVLDTSGLTERGLVARHWRTALRAVLAELAGA